MSDLFKAAAVWGTPGGKRLLAKRLVLMLPAHTTYTEPFAGAGAIFFAKERADTEVLNDIDPEVVAAYRAIKSLTKDELKRLAAQSWTGNRTTWDNLRKSNPGNKVDRLYKFLYVTRFSYGRMRGQSFNTGNAGTEATTIIPKVIKAHDRLRGVKLCCGDYAKVIKEHDGPDALHFLDPPYPGHDTNYGKRSSFDEDVFYKLLQGVKGKFLAVTGTRGRKEWGGFKVHKISHYRHMRRAKGGDSSKVKLDNLVIANFDVIRKSLGGGFWFLDMSKAFPGGQPEAGLHNHSLRREDEKTAKDGAHKHAFKLGDQVVWTDEDGVHEHKIESWENLGGGPHAHRVTLPGMGENGEDLVIFTSPDGSYHGHQLQSSHTAFDGVHTHILQVGAELMTSLTGKDLWEMQGKPEQANIPDSPPASAIAALAMNKAGPGHSVSDPFTAGKVSVGADGQIYVDAHDVAATITAALAKRLPAAAAANTRVVSAPPPIDHVDIAEIVIRPTEERTIKQHAIDVTGRVEMREQGDAQHYFALDDSGVDIGRFGSRRMAERVLEETVAMKSDDGLPSVLSWSSVERGAMPPPGMSMLPPSLERQVPERLRFWKMAGERARQARDALVDSGFADAIMSKDGELVAVRSAVAVCKANDLADAPDRPGSLEQVVAEMAGDDCGVWEHADPPDRDIEHEGAVFVPATISQRWALSGTLPDAIDLFAKHSAGALIACPDSVAARSSMSMAGGVLQVRRAACANMVFHATAPRLAKARFMRELAHVPMDIAFEAETEFKLGKSADGTTYLVVGQHAYLLSKSLDSGASFAALVDEPEGLDILDSGLAIEKDDGVFRMFRLRGEQLAGEFSARPTGSMWRITKDAAPIDDIRVRSLHKAEGKDEQYILGIAMEPEVIDAHNDITSAMEIRQAAHDYMIKSRQVKLQHTRRTNRVVVVQSYTAPHKLNIGGQRVKADTWLMGMLVLDPGLWKRFLAGDYTGLSIGGTGFRDPSV